MKGRKKQYLRTMGWLLLTGAWMFSSCADDEWVKNEPATTGEGIFFGITPADSIWKPDTRSTTSGKNFVLRGENTEDTLCVSTSVMEGINASREVHSRGTTLNSLAEQSFNVTAYYYSDKNETTPSATYFENETVKVNNDGSSTNMANTYYWPQNGEITFLATANGGENLTINDKGKNADYLATPSLSYTVPDDVENQKDVMVAYTGRINNAADGTAVPLTFNHLCAAVQFQLASEVENAISSISISGVKGGTVNYTYDNGNWTPSSTTDEDKTYSINIETPITNNTVITSNETNTTLLLTPQTLTENAKITVTFSDGRTSVSTEVGALNGKEWKMGQTFIFKLSITPEYTLEFVSQPTVQDAHYVIYPITIKADKLPEGGWTLTSNDEVNVTFVEKFPHDDIKSIVDAGYWLEEYKGESSITSTTTGDAITVYAFLTENITKSERSITLSLKPANQKYDKTETFTFTQYCPTWNEDTNLGVEQIEDGDYVWGFKWDSNIKLQYKFTANNIETGIKNVLITIYLNWFSGYEYVSTTGIINPVVTIDFSKVKKLDTAIDNANGLQNTWDIYTFDGVHNASALIEQLKAWGGELQGTELPGNPIEFAARACAMKNKYSVEKSTSGNNTVYRPVLKQENLVWYLPAKDEVSKMKTDNLSGNYWTSTAITDPGTTAYKYTVGSDNNNSSAEDRNTTLHVRAVRQKPSAQ